MNIFKTQVLQLVLDMGFWEPEARIYEWPPNGSVLSEDLFDFDFWDHFYLEG